MSDDLLFLGSLIVTDVLGLAMGLLLGARLIRYVKAHFVRSQAIFVFGLIIGVALGILICLVVLGIAVTPDIELSDLWMT